MFTVPYPSSQFMLSDKCSGVLVRVQWDPDPVQAQSEQLRASERAKALLQSRVEVLLREEFMPQAHSNRVETARIRHGEINLQIQHSFKPFREDLIE